MEIALSSGCFIGHEREIAHSRVKAVELSAHRPELLGEVLADIGATGGRVLGIHCPCPSRGVGLNPGGEGEAWIATERAIIESAQIAHACGAEYILVHAFYCVPQDLPAEDVARMRTLRNLFGGDASIFDYVNSEQYSACKARAISNLKSLVPRIRRDFPGLKLIVENLNPRLGYGGILFQDVVDIAEALDGEVGICLDLGHLTLASAALDHDMEQSVKDAGPLIFSVHAHDNFGGEFCVDRRWNVAAPDPHLQDVDIHLPFLTRYCRSEQESAFQVMADNSAFSQILKGGAHYTDAPDATLLKGAVPIDHLLTLVPESAHLIFEFDSRYAPLHEVLAEYTLAVLGNHPRLTQMARVAQ